MSMRFSLSSLYEHGEEQSGVDRVRIDKEPVRCFGGESDLPNPRRCVGASVFVWHSSFRTPYIGGNER